MNKIFTISALVLALSACKDDNIIADAGNSLGTTSISGFAYVGKTLSATVNDANGVEEANISYEWMSAGVAIAGAASSTYLISDADVGNTITVTVNYTDNADYTETAKSVETAAVIVAPVNVAGVVTISGTVESGEELSADVVDDNGFSSENASYVWMADGTDAIGTDSSTYTLTDDEIGKTITVEVTYVDNNDYSEVIVSAATAAVTAFDPNIDAEFSGDLTGTTLSDGSADATGTAIVTDADAGQDTFVVQTDAATTYGTFSITEAGAWTYSVDTSNATIAAFSSADDMEVDVVTLTSADGTTTELLITINGAGATVDNKVARIVDANDSDTGELRFKLSDESIDPMVTGKLSFSFNREVGLDTEDSKDAYLTLYGGSTSTDPALLDIRLKEGGAIHLRNGNGDDVVLDQTYIHGEWVDVEVTWDASSASDTVTPVMTITIDGVAITSATSTAITAGSFSSMSSSPTDVKGGVEVIAFRLADNSALVSSAYFVDDLKLYSDLAGAITPVFEDDFESYADGASLDTDNDNSPYNGSTSDATIEVQTVAAPVAEAPAGPSKVARIVDANDSDTGELRFKLSDESIDPMVTGKLAFSFNRETGLDTESSKDAYLTLYGSSTSTDPALLDIRLKEGGAIHLRNGNGDDVVLDQGYNHGEWVDVELTWDATNASDTVTPVMAITIDGVAITSSTSTAITAGSFSSMSSSPTDVKGGVEVIAFRLADNSALVSSAYFVDDVKLYSDLAGATTPVFEDDFESYADGASLDNDNDASPYNGSTSDATVEDQSPQ